MVSNIFGTRDQFHGRQFFHGLGVWGGGVGLGIIPAHYIYYAADLTGGGAQV